MQKAIKKWEAIRRHDTDPKQRASLVSEVLKEVGRSLNRSLPDFTSVSLLALCMCACFKVLMYTRFHLRRNVAPLALTTLQLQLLSALWNYKGSLK